MRNIHCLNNISKRGTDTLPENYTLSDDLSSADGILVRSAALHDMEFPESLLAIARAGAGVNNIPLDRCAQEGIVVFNTPGANANAVKEIVICSMLLGARDIVGGINWVKDNADDPNIKKAVEKAKKTYAGTEIIGKKLGVIGLGAIGSLVANAAIDLGMEVYGYDPYVSLNAAWSISSQVNYETDLNRLCETCDYITIHVPAIESTIGMVGAEQLALMQPHAVLLNFSRDTIVDTPAAIEELEKDNLGKYITDFATPELVNAKGVMVLPHLGASTAEAEDNCAIMAAAEIVDFIENGNIKNSVNYPACDMGARPAEGTRIAVMHQNIPGMISGITDTIQAEKINLANITSKARGDYAYTLIDLDQDLSEDGAKRILDIEGIIRVRTM